MDDISTLKQIADSSSQLSAWALLVGGGSVATVVSGSYYRPRSVLLRFPYLLFVPGWIYLGRSLLAGNSIVREYLASLMVRKDQLAAIASQVNDAYAEQGLDMLVALLFFGVWLAIYLLLWIFVGNFREATRK